MLGKHLTFWPITFALLASTLPIIGCCSTKSAASVDKRVNDIALEKIDVLIDLARHPESISPQSVEQLFHTQLQSDSCDSKNSSCRLSAELKDDEVSVTNVFIPNPRTRQYRAGGNVVLEIPRNSCIPVGEIARRLQSKPARPADPPTRLSYTPQEEPDDIESLLVFENMPGMDKEVSISSWSDRTCLVRLELNALLKSKE